MKKFLLVFCSVWGWVCIIGAGVAWGYKVAAVVAFAALMTAIIAAILTNEKEGEPMDAITPLEEILNGTKGGGKNDET